MAKYLLAEKKFEKIQIFEQRPVAGGVWNYTSADREDGFVVPRIAPTTAPDQVVYHANSDKPEIVSPVYDMLETNIPHTLMNYTETPFQEGTSLFPTHQVVLEYLQSYAEDLAPYASYSTQVQHLCKNKSGDRPCWKIETLDLVTKETKTHEFDAVAVASGHYNDPFIPDIPGIKDFNKANPGVISHSKYYRRPDAYQDKKVIVVGNSASGIDLSVQLSATAQLPVFISEKEKATPGAVVQESKPWARHVPEIAVRFANGHIETDMDAVLFCTGYHYSFPFARDVRPPVVVDVSHAAHLWEHMLYTADPTVAFLAVPQRIVPFPVAEAQSALIARIWAGRLAPPSAAEMTTWLEEQVASKGAGKALHNLMFPKDVEYINRLHDRSVTAGRVDGGDNDGQGKLPPYWGGEKRWTRERFPAIKLASRALGKERHKVRSLSELGFDYEEWKKRTAGVAEELI
ncbi:uncharacterized protein F5Z01DRAFT_524154 [Emericellopsis atlantica]|uniref:Thiol-specific monooxygenase n=1 Tax=Emericellopsis atlantica TaxID=2614577 RepID=A0A9P7ZPW3_9HYPO|nr:uncharacterized protein F5Z01DRAFT_524154 [Emericellopsis atlantica]KAG9255911.1 hypothetical protein F5Z01DRAFT_524154 [Emericellopsis atlantica]